MTAPPLEDLKRGRPWHRRVADTLLFLGEFIREFQQTGSMFPTSVAAARVLTAPLRDRERPLRILELGPGTGAVTHMVLSLMRPGDTLAICEINERFMAALQHRVSLDPVFPAHREQVRFLRCGAQELPLDGRYDVIICSLPFVNFGPELVHAIFNRLRLVSHPDTVMTFYEYPEFKHLGRLLAGAERRVHMAEVEAYLEAQGRQRFQRVLLNLPPMQVYTLRVAPPTAA